MEGANHEELSDSEVEAGSSESSAENTWTETDKAVATFDFGEKSWMTDFILNVEGTKLYVAKNILSLASPVFERMFQSEFKDSRSDELVLPGKKIKDVKALLRCIYPNIQDPITSDNAMTFLPLVEEYQVLHLKNRCESVLMESIGNATSVEELFELLRKSDIYNLIDLRKKCIFLASEKSDEELLEAKTSCKPPVEALTMIYENKIVKMKEIIAGLESENANFKTKLHESKDHNVQKLSEERDVWKKCVVADLKKSKSLCFDKGYKWKELHVVFTPSVAEIFSTSVQTQIWDITFGISTSLTRRAEYSDSLRCQSYFHILSVEFKNSSSAKVSCKLNTLCRLTCTQPNGENVLVNGNFTFNNTYQSRKIDIKRISEIENVDSGFIRDGKIAMIVHIYMSEPNVI